MLKGNLLHILILSAGKILKNPYGGEDLFSRLLAKWLATLHHEVTLMGIEYAGIRVKHVTFDNANNELAKKNRKVKSKPAKFRYSQLLYSLRTIFWISQVIRIIAINITNRLSLIHAQDSGYTGLAAIIAGKILHIPVIITLHGIRYRQIESNPHINNILKRVALAIERRLDVFTLRNANFVTIVSETFKTYVKEACPKSPVENIPVAISINDFEFSQAKRDLIRRDLRIKNQLRVIGYVGRLSYEKNLTTLIYSFADAVKQDQSLILVLVGEGTLEMDLRKQSKDLNLKDKVIFYGFRDDIGNILSSFDIFVLPSYIEGTSNAVIQAMTCGLPIICSDIPGNRELVTNNEDALLVEPNNRDGFRDAFLRLSSDEALRSKLGFKAKINARQYDKEIIFPKFLRSYKNLCNISA